jgi:uncharacterized protein
MKKLFLATAVFFVAFASHGASFDCEKATTLVEKTICQDPELSHLDELLTQTYKTALNATKEPDALRSQQKAWRTNVRNKCLDSVCLKGVSIQRLAVLGDVIANKYPWMMKHQWDLTKAECKTAMQHDREYWWGKGKCRNGRVRYAFGVITRDPTNEHFVEGCYLKGSLIMFITQFRPIEGEYCSRICGCLPAKDIKLLGSSLTGNRGSKSGDETDLWQGVSSSCELILADRKNIIAANLHENARYLEIVQGSSCLP